MARAEFSLDDGFSDQAFGLIVLASDETLEPELAPLFAKAGRTLYHSRIPSAPNVTPETLAQMELDLPSTASLFPAKSDLSAIGYGCTSGSTVIGSERVAALVQSSCPNIPVTNPLDASLAAFAACGAQRIAVLTPYREDVTQALLAAFEAHGLSIVAVQSFEQENETTVARISEKSVAQTLVALGQAPCDAVFASCTNLRSFSVIADVEATIGKPAITSNSALAWHMAQLGGAALPGPGQIFAGGGLPLRRAIG
ncbi:MAG: Asp/Glu racemase [Pseudomonadota bacterium]